MTFWIVAESPTGEFTIDDIIGTAENHGVLLGTINGRVKARGQFISTSKLGMNNVTHEVRNADNTVAAYLMFKELRCLDS